MKRNTNYPTIGLERAVSLTEKIYGSVVDAAIDGATVLNLMGYGGVSGTSATALAALKKYGLIEGRDQELRVTELAKRILRPLDGEEKLDALKEAASKPDLYVEIRERFGGQPPSDDVLKSFLTRNYGFRPKPAVVFVKAFRETEEFIAHNRPLSMLPCFDDGPSQDSTESLRDAHVRKTTDNLSSDRGTDFSRSKANVGDRLEVMTFRLSPEVRVELTFDGRITQKAITKLIAFLELAKDGYIPDTDIEAPDGTPLI